MGTVLHHILAILRPPPVVFQSPSRWGRCCIATIMASHYSDLLRFSPLLDGDGVASHRLRSDSRASYGVSVPFSMGTVLHPLRSAIRIERPVIRFSPLLDGDGVASRRSDGDRLSVIPVSVPFSMGTVLHQGVGASMPQVVSGFSPLLDGDGVASRSRCTRCSHS